jgi:acetyl-CoA acetyltransferase
MPPEPVISGVGEAGIGVVPGRSSMAMHVDALEAACADAGLDIAELDGLITCNSMVEPYARHAMVLGEQLGIMHTLDLVESVALGGASATTAVGRAALEIAAGRCRHVAVVTADPQLSGMTRDLAVATMSSFRHAEFEAPYGPTNASCFAFFAQRYASLYQDPRPALTTIAVQQRHNSSLTKSGHMREELTAADVENSRLISDPLRLLDCSLISDAGGAVIVSAASAAPAAAVSVLGWGRGFANHDHISRWDGSFAPETLGAARSFGTALAQSGIDRDALDIAYLYDCFTITPLLLLEQLGFCGPGEGVDFVADRDISLSGGLPINTHGGLLSYAHAGYPSIVLALVEAVRQLRGEVEQERQVRTPRHALVHGLGGMFSVHSSVVLGR